MDIDNTKADNKNWFVTKIGIVFQYANILTIVGIIIAVVSFYLSEKRKELTLSIDSFISLVDKNALKGSEIKVTYKSIAVDNLCKGV
jgi:hypothetical protein